MPMTGRWHMRWKEGESIKIQITNDKFTIQNQNSKHLKFEFDLMFVDLIFEFN